MTAALAAAGAARPRAVLFDWDNTLVDSWGTIHEAMVVTLTALGREPWTLEATKARVRHSLRDSFPLLFGGDWQQAKRLYIDAFTAIHLDRLSPLEGAESLLADLKAAGCWLGVVSNKTGRLLRREADQLGWTRHFDVIVGAGDAETDKPTTAPVDLALSGSGIPRGRQVWFVGDTAIDMECAAAAGCVGVLLSPGPADEGEFTRYRPELSYEHCRSFGQAFAAM